MENIKFIPHFACLHGQKLKNSVIENISSGSKPEVGVVCFVLYADTTIRLLFSCCQRPVFSSYHVVLL